MSLDVTEGGRKAAISLLASCGGRLSIVAQVALELNKVDASGAKEVFSRFAFIPAISELLATCEEVNGVVDSEGVVRHFSSQQHLDKITSEGSTIAAELPRKIVPFAHTLLPVTIVGGKYLVELGDHVVELRGLITQGKSVGSLFAHLASLIWVEDDLIWSEISDEQERNRVGQASRAIELIDYEKAPVLRKATLDLAAELGS